MASLSRGGTVVLDAMTLDPSLQRCSPSVASRCTSLIDCSTSSPRVRGSGGSPECEGVVDADADGIDDAIDSGSGTFQDGGTTAGTIGTIPAGYTVAVMDLPDPDGVHVTVTARVRKR